MPYYPDQPNQQGKGCPPRKGVFLRRMILCVSALLVLYGGIRLVSYLSDLASSRQTAKELREEMTRAEASAAPERTEDPGAPAEEAAGDSAALPDKLPEVPYPNGYELVPRIQELRKKSENIIGWITMDDLDEPVAMKDNDFFLNHDAMGKRNVNGSIFMDQGTNLLTRPYTILLYGHNMKTGAMFGNLRKYEQFSYCYKHRVFQFDTLYEEGKYEIFAVATISVTPGKAKYVNLPGLQGADRKTRAAALESLVNASPHGRFTEVGEEDQVLLLITCVGDEDERLVVAAKRI